MMSGMERRVVALTIERDRLTAQVAELRMALVFIESQENAADNSVGLVDYPHTKALRAACKHARAALAKVRP